MSFSAIVTRNFRQCTTFHSRHVSQQVVYRISSAICDMSHLKMCTASMPSIIIYTCQSKIAAVFHVSFPTGVTLTSVLHATLYMQHVSFKHLQICDVSFSTSSTRKYVLCAVFHFQHMSLENFYNVPCLFFHTFKRKFCK